MRKDEGEKAGSQGIIHGKLYKNKDIFSSQKGLLLSSMVEFTVDDTITAIFSSYFHTNNAVESSRAHTDSSIAAILLRRRAWGGLVSSVGVHGWWLLCYYY